MLNDKGEEVGIIYGWYNTKNEKWYIGQTIDEKRRFKQHIDGAINKKDNGKFHRALRKYGLENWVYCVLEDNILRANLNMREMYWVEEFDSFYNGYNLTTGGDTNCIFSEETKEKLKNRTPWNKGKHGIYSEETLKKMSESLKGKTGYWTGKHRSEESRIKMSESLKIKMAPYRKQVSQYNLNGNFIKEYDCIKDAVKENPKAVHIGEVCKGYRKQSGGFIWKFAS